jgi:hypothetical protein
MPVRYRTERIPFSGGRSTALPSSEMRSATALCTVVASLAVVSGCGNGSTPGAAPATTVTVIAVEHQAAAPKATVTVAAPAQPAPTVTAAAPARTTPSGDASFWRLIAETRNAAGNDTGRQSQLLEERLTHLSPQQIVEFARFRHRLDERAYTYNLWAAAYVIDDGCSDDCFRDFRAYLISLGQAPYEAALRNPDSLASVVQDADKGNWENADNVAPDAYSSVTSNDFPLDTSDLSGTPRGTPFNENNIASLVHRFPRLAARFR